MVWFTSLQHLYYLFYFILFYFIIAPKTTPLLVTESCVGVSNRRILTRGSRFELKGRLTRTFIRPRTNKRFSYNLSLKFVTHKNLLADLFHQKSSFLCNTVFSHAFETCG